MKKLIALLMAAMMLLSLAAACGNDAPAETPTTPTSPAPTTPAPTTPTTPAPTQPADPDAEKYGGDLVIATSSVSYTMDPHHSAGATSNYQWMQNVYETTIAMGADGQYYPMTCSYEYAPDGLTLKLTMVEGKKFSDGTPVTIEDVIASWERAGAIGGSFATKVMDYVSEIKIEGDSATIYFSEMNVTMMQEISDGRGPGWIMPKAICEKYGTNEITDIKDVIGSGPYVLDVYKPDTEIVMKRNENYVATDNGDVTGMAATRKAYTDSIKFAVNGDSASLTAAMIAGDYHIGSILTEMQAYAEQIGLKRTLLHNQWTHAVFFNLDESNADSPVADVNFRKAFRAALDMKGIMLSILQGDAERIDLNCSPVTPLNTAYYNDIIESVEWNIADKELAKSYLAKTNYNGEPIVWLVNPNGNFYRAAMAAIPMLEEVGIKIDLRVVDAGSHSSMRADPATGHDIGAWENQKGLANPYECGSMTGQTTGWWSNDKKTELLEIMRTNPTGSEASIQAYKDLCYLITEEVPWVGFGTHISSTYTQPNVELNYQGPHSYYWNTYFAK